jgi:hypothetical protein
MAQPPRACLTCGALSTGTRCERCTTARQTAATARRHRPHYNYAYRKQAKLIRDNATHCWICGEGEKLNDPWTADHLLPADINSPLSACASQLQQFTRQHTNHTEQALTLPFTRTRLRSKRRKAPTPIHPSPPSLAPPPAPPAPRTHGTRSPTASAFVSLAHLVRLCHAIRLRRFV